MRSAKPKRLKEQDSQYFGKTVLYLDSVNLEKHPLKKRGISQVIYRCNVAHNYENYQKSKIYE